MKSETTKFYVDQVSWDEPINIDDFLITIGENKSNSVYHVFETRRVKRENRMVRTYVKVYRSDLQTALIRDKTTQKIVTLK